jgi:hypothetical protein
MTYGTLDGTLPPPPPAPKHTPQQYDGGTTLPAGQGTYSNDTPFSPPGVPGGKSGGKGTTVDTPSMKLFADNMDKLIAPTQAAAKKLDTVVQGLGDLRDGVRELASRYATLEDANKMTATDLDKAMQSANGDFSVLLTDSGGTPPATGA